MYYNGTGFSTNQSSVVMMSIDETSDTLSETDYYPMYSTYEIFRADNQTHDLEQDLVAIETDISALETAVNGKANSTHTHTATDVTGLATVATSGSYNDLIDKPTIPTAYSHLDTHPASMITGLATVATSGSYEYLSDKPTIPTIPTSLPANGGNADTVDGKHSTDFATADHNHNTVYATVADFATVETAVNGKANSSHTHAQSEITGLTTALSGKANSSHSHDEYALVTDLSTLSETVTSKANSIHSHPTYT